MEKEKRGYRKGDQIRFLKDCNCRYCPEYKKRHIRSGYSLGSLSKTRLIKKGHTMTIIKIHTDGYVIGIVDKYGISRNRPVFILAWSDIPKTEWLFNLFPNVGKETTIKASFSDHLLKLTQSDIYELYRKIPNIQKYFYERWEKISEAITRLGIQESGNVFTLIVKSGFIKKDGKDYLLMVVIPEKISEDYDIQFIVVNRVLLKIDKKELFDNTICSSDYSLTQIELDEENYNDRLSMMSTSDLEYKQQVEEFFAISQSILKIYSLEAKSVFPFSVKCKYEVGNVVTFKKDYPTLHYYRNWIEEETMETIIKQNLLKTMRETVINRYCSALIIKIDDDNNYWLLSTYVLDGRRYKIFVKLSKQELVDLCLFYKDITELYAAAREAKYQRCQTYNPNEHTWGKEWFDDNIWHEAALYEDLIKALRSLCLCQNDKTTLSIDNDGRVIIREGYYPLYVR